MFGKGSTGEILLRLTYKAYVEDEEDDKRNAKAIYADASDDEMSDSEEPSSFVQNDKIPSDDIGQESFMNVLSALILSEEFQGIVSSETGNNKVDDGESSVSPVPSMSGADSESRPKDAGNGDVSDLEVKNAKSDRGSINNGGISRLYFMMNLFLWLLCLKLLSFVNFRISIIVVRCNHFCTGARCYQHGRLKFLQPVTWCCMDNYDFFCQSKYEPRNENFVSYAYGCQYQLTSLEYMYGISAYS